MASMWWLKYGMPFRGSCVDRGTGKPMDLEGSGLIKGWFLYESIIWWHHWEMGSSWKKLVTYAGSSFPPHILTSVCQGVSSFALPHSLAWWHASPWPRNDGLIRVDNGNIRYNSGHGILSSPKRRISSVSLRVFLGRKHPPSSPEFCSQH